MYQKKSSMKKSGKPILFGFLAGCLIYELMNKNNFKKQIKDNVTMTQYRNRLMEFFDQDSIDAAFKEMNDFIGFGLSPSTAFEMMTVEES